MSGERWQRVWAVFEEAVGRPPEARGAYLDEACDGDDRLRRAVERMLAADGEVDTFLDASLAPPAGDLGLEPQAAARPLPRDTMIGSYRILRPIGQGGMSTAYLAVRADDAFQRRVVLKLVRAGMESEAVLLRLRRERQILAGLDHPYIARLYDGGSTDDGLPYFVLEYIDGEPIDAYCERNELSVDERLTLFRKTCAAVHYAHQNLVVHRDLKPSNILVVADGTPKLLDFGIAKLLNPEIAAAEIEPTATWHRVLTPNYASPEQLRGDPITTASDVYSLGVLLYKLLTGRLPHGLAGRSPREIERHLSESEPLPPSVAVTREESVDGDASEASDRPGATPSGPRRGELQRRLAGDLDAIVLKALRTAPPHRYGSADQLAADIERHQQGLPVEARAGGFRYRAGKLMRRHRKAVVAAAVIATLVVGFVVAMAVQASRVARERDRTRHELDKKAQVLSLVLELFRFSNPYVAPGEELTVREALERSVPVLEEGLHDQPEVRAELLHTSGSILTILGQPATARDQLLEALEIRRGRHGEHHPDIADTLRALAAAHKVLGELDRAEELARSAVGIARGLGVGTGVLTAPLNELASVLCYRSAYDAAEEPSVEALALTRDLPAGRLQRIAALEHLALIRSEQGNYREAVKLNREALALRRAQYGERHPDLIATLNNLGLNLRQLEELDSAQRAYEEALSLQLEVFGPDHSDPYLLNNLAGVRSALGDFVEAERLYGEAREAAARSFGAGHWMVFFFELRLGQAQIHQGAPEEAEGRLRPLLERWRPTLGDHWRLAEGEGVLGASLSAQGRCSEAEPLLVGSFERLLEVASVRTQQAALDRLRSHFEHCGEAQEIAAFEARLAAGGAS